MTSSDFGAPYTDAENQINRIFDRLNQRIGAAIMSAADDAVTAVTTQLGKAKTEIDGLIAQLEGSSVSPATLDQLKATSQALDDIVPDQVAPPAEPPADEPPVA